MSITIEIYPTQFPKDILFNIKGSLKKKYSLDLDFKNGDLKENQLHFSSFAGRENMSSNKIISKGCLSLFLTIFKIEKDIDSAEDIIGGIMLFNKNEEISNKFINDFDNIGYYFSLESMAKRGDNELKTMIFIAKELAKETNGIIVFTEGAYCFNINGKLAYTGKNISDIIEFKED